MPNQTRRLWSSREDYMAECCRNEDFRAAPPHLHEAEDPDFQAHIRRIAAGAQPRRSATAPIASGCIGRR
jgi:hypothetical protein